jgi:putative transposase
MALCYAQLNLVKAFANFCRNSGHFRFPNPGHFRSPRYRCWHNDRPSYTANLMVTNIAFPDERHLKLPRLCAVRVVRHREIPDGRLLKSVTVSRNLEGRFITSDLFEFPEAPSGKAPIDPGNVLGLDFSMPELYVDSDGNRAGAPKA